MNAIFFPCDLRNPFSLPVFSTPLSLSVASQSRIGNFIGFLFSPFPVLSSFFILQAWAFALGSLFYPFSKCSRRVLRSFIVGGREFFFFSSPRVFFCSPVGGDRREALFLVTQAVDFVLFFICRFHFRLFFARCGALLSPVSEPPPLLKSG